MTPLKLWPYVSVMALLICLPYVVSQPPPAGQAEEEKAISPPTQPQISGPHTHENLSVFFIHGPELLTGCKFLTLQEALEQKKACVYETGNVNELAIENLSENEELFVQAFSGKELRDPQLAVWRGKDAGRLDAIARCKRQLCMS